MKLKYSTFGIFPKEMLEGKKPYVQLIFTWLCTHANNDSLECFPSYDKLAKEAGVSKKTVERSVNELVEMGYLKKEQRRMDGSPQLSSNLYTVILK